MKIAKAYLTWVIARSMTWPIKMVDNGESHELFGSSCTKRKAGSITNSEY